LVCHTLVRTEETMRKRIDNNQLTFQDIFAYMNSRSFNSSIDNECRAIPKDRSLSDEQKKICSIVHSNGMYPFTDTDENILHLVKTRRFSGQCANKVAKYYWIWNRRKLSGTNMAEGIL